MRRFLRRVVGWFVVAAMLFAAGIGYLMARTADPRESPGWERLADMPRARGEVATAVSDGKLYAVGGLAGLGRTVDTVSVFDAVARRWTEGPDLPAARHHPGAAAHDGAIYVTGGATRATNWKPEAQLWILEPGAREWSQGPAMPQGRMGHQMAPVGGKIYVVGGRGETSNVLVYDPRSREWSTGAEMPAKRDHLGVAVVGRRLYAIGGRDDDLLRRVDVYDTRADSWAEGPPLPQPMSAMATAVLADGIHVVGGEDPTTLTGTVLDRHYLLKRGTQDWTPASLPIVATHGSAGGEVNGRLVIAGGSRRQGALSPLGWTGIAQSFVPTP